MKRNEIISLLLPLRVAFLFSFQTTDCPRSPANSRELTDNAAAINKVVLLHIHINQTSNSTILKKKKKAAFHRGGGGRCEAGWCLMCIAVLAELVLLTSLPSGPPALSSPRAPLTPFASQHLGSVIFALLCQKQPRGAQFSIGAALAGCGQSFTPALEVEFIWEPEILQHNGQGHRGWDEEPFLHPVCLFEATLAALNPRAGSHTQLRDPRSAGTLGSGSGARRGSSRSVRVGWWERLPAFSILYRKFRILCKFESKA